MTETTAFSSLMDLISFLGTFISAPIWFGLSFLNFLVIAYCIHFVIGLLLGGIAPLSPLERRPIAQSRPLTRADAQNLISSSKVDIKLPGYYSGYAREKSIKK